MRKIITAFRESEDGAVTVDFVVLTAAITMLGLIVITSFASGTVGLGDKIQNSLNAVPV